MKDNRHHLNKKKHDRNDADADAAHADVLVVPVKRGKCCMGLLTLATVNACVISILLYCPFYFLSRPFFLLRNHLKSRTTCQKGYQAEQQQQVNAGNSQY